MKTKKGFSLVELLVAMAIIAVLISIAAFGISIVQRNARNTQRRKELDNLRLTITEVEMNSQSVLSGISGSNTITVSTSKGSSTYNVSSAFSTVTVAAPCSLTTEEASSTAIYLCYNSATTPRTIGTRLEGTTMGYTISLGE